MGIKNPSGKPDKILGGYLRWTGFPCWGNAITRRRLVIQKWAITTDRKSTRLNSSHVRTSRMPSSA